MRHARPWVTTLFSAAQIFTFGKLHLQLLASTGLATVILRAVYSSLRNRGPSRDNYHKQFSRSKLNRLLATTSEGVRVHQAGSNPRILRRRLEAFIATA